MKKSLKLLYIILQSLFYIFAMLTIIAFIFYIFGARPLTTVGYTLLTAIVFLFTYAITYRIYTTIYKEEDIVKTEADHMEELKNKQ
ncbi:MAG: hypothetical protein ACOC1L_04565 [Bacillota bacterium]